MILTTKVKLICDDEVSLALKSSMVLFSQLCNRISELSMEQNVFKQFSIHKIFYQQLRTEFPAAASQLVIRAIANVAGDFSREKNLHHYKETSALKLDQRLYSINEKHLSVWTVAGRLKLPMKFTKKHLALKHSFGAAEIKQDRVSGNFFILFSYTADVSASEVPVNVIGVDKGIVNLATTSTGLNFSGAKIEAARKKFYKHRRSLQKCGTKSAKRRLKKLSRRESRFKADVNHQISKQLVENAKGTASAIALENLSGISKRTTVTKEQRARHKGWSFYQLDSFIAYKAERAGVKVVFVDPAYTSQQCPVCGTTSKQNRKIRDTFSCVSCKHTADADLIGAINIRARGADLLGLNVNHPIVAITQAFSA